MVSTQQIDLILSVARVLTVDKRFVAGVGALWFYDYLLTVSDEIKYAWSGRTSLIFVLFILNRYWPLWYLVWLFIAFWNPEYTRPVCDKTAWLSMFYFSTVTLFAQAAITLRIYAVTGNSRWIASYLSFVTLAQFAFGLYLTVWFALRPAFQIPDLPFDEFKACLFHRWRTGVIIYTVVSPVYDISAFALVVHSARRRNHARAHGVPSLLDKIVQDATVYFLAIFTCHFLLIFFELFAPAPIQLLPGRGNAVLIPLMVTRLILSLKKAANPSYSQSLWGSNNTAQVESARFAHHTIGGTERGGGDIVLRHLSTDKSGLARSRVQD
ncbi:hypothetical protein BDM02DRAFT_3264071 [Thelephora ganbajun]|uniref:Uncharacterized protein n=1 Tax=Thelephora ganbajun TaxID=370292 RepID=A0ACB6Z1W2_THEGA|nr:hypothetical protein BDM02DRAFT_3264071 [Thelephora ganbajun]